MDKARAIELLKARLEQERKSLEEAEGLPGTAKAAILAGTIRENIELYEFLLEYLK